MAEVTKPGRKTMPPSVINETCSNRTQANPNHNSVYNVNLAKTIKGGGMGINKNGVDLLQDHKECLNNNVTMHNNAKSLEHKELSDLNEIKTDYQQMFKTDCYSHMMRAIKTVKAFNICDTKTRNILIKHKSERGLDLLECINCKIQLLSAQSYDYTNNLDNFSFALAAHYNSANISSGGNM